MRKWELSLAAGVALMFLANTADAGTRETVLKKYAEVFATAELCPDVEVNTILLATTALTFGIDIQQGTRDFDDLNALAVSKMHEMENTPVADVCAAGIALYGPNGVGGKNLLLEK